MPSLFVVGSWFADFRLKAGCGVCLSSLLGIIDVRSVSTGKTDEESILTVVMNYHPTFFLPYSWSNVQTHRINKLRAALAERDNKITELKREKEERENPAPKPVDTEVVSTGDDVQDWINSLEKA